MIFKNQKILIAGVADVLGEMFLLLGKDLSNQKLLPYLLDLFTSENLENKIWYKI